MCQIWLRSDRRECNAGMTIAKCTKTAASSNVSNHLSRTPAAWCASGAAHHARPYRNLGRHFFTQLPLATPQTKHHCVLIFSTTLISDIYLELFGYRELRIATAVAKPIRQGIYINFLINVHVCCRKFRSFDLGLDLLMDKVK